MRNASSTFARWRLGALLWHEYINPALVLVGCFWVGMGSSRVCGGRVGEVAESKTFACALSQGGFWWVLVSAAGTAAGRRRFADSLWMVGESGRKGAGGEESFGMTETRKAKSGARAAHPPLKSRARRPLLHVTLQFMRLLQMMMRCNRHTLFLPAWLICMCSDRHMIRRIARIEGNFIVSYSFCADASGSPISAMSLILTTFLPSTVSESTTAQRFPQTMEYTRTL